VVGGHVYIGAGTGVFYALDEATGRVLWHQFLGFVPKKNCGARGIDSTATVAPDPMTGALTVYVSGGDGYLYALSAATGAIVWKSVIALPSPKVSDYYDWSSPTVSNGRIYMGVASQCCWPRVAVPGRRSLHANLLRSVRCRGCVGRLASVHRRR